MTRGYPTATSPAVSAVMRANYRRDTKPELGLRRQLHAAGLRYRVDRPVSVVGGRTIRPDVVFGPAKVAVFVHGCFWHRCPIHGTEPGGRNAEYWKAKLDRNVTRDELNLDALSNAGWQVIVVWEHEDPRDAADRVERALARSRLRELGLLEVGGDIEKRG
jgi:DNA mismatch endonuclease, patch repair protein